MKQKLKSKTKFFLPEQTIINQKYILPTLKLTKKSDNLIKKQEENEKYALENKEKIGSIPMLSIIFKFVLKL
ncbi:hypothetical protein [Spiroplasma endosymbiont of Tricholauxania praeusta]|uniref:hypothetical protein n=1 Tax=Spiroplasma endosymbiont of Tricholauxania praeusta TaxID=3066296 RepID=UPI0030CA857F